MKFKVILLSLFLSAISFGQIAKYGTGAPPQFNFTSTSSLSIYHGLNTTHVIVDCFDGTGTALPRGRTDTNGFTYQITNANSVVVTFNSSSSGWCTVNGGIGIGLQGVQGVQGMPGLKGDTGPIGPGFSAAAVDTTSKHLILTKTDGTVVDLGNVQGPQGLQGAIGTPGAAGLNGLSTYQNSGAPFNSLGSDSETYIDSANGDLYKKAAGVWTKTGTLQGPQGLRGPAGAGATWRGVWNAAIQYAVNDIVQYGGSSYISIQASLNVIPTNAGFWNLSASAGASGPAGVDGAPGPKGDPGGNPVGTTASANYNQFLYVNGLPVVPRQAVNYACSGCSSSDDGVGITTINIPPGGGGTGITQLTGDGTTPSNSSGSTALTLSSVNSSPGTFGDSTHAVQLTVDAKGRITAISTNAISGGGGGGSSILSGSLASMPTTCFTGTLYLATDQPVMLQLYSCSPDNTFNPIFSIGSSTALAVTSGTLDIATSVIPRLTIDNTFSGSMTIQNGMSLKTTNSKPTCTDDTNRGKFWFVNNGASKDNVQVCVYTGSAYTWTNLY